MEGAELNQESDQNNGCCGRFFIAEVAEDQPGELLLECCACGKVWRRQADGRILPRATAADVEGADSRTQKKRG